MPSPNFDSDIVVVGIGNIVHTDDGAGVHALQMLRDSLASRPAFRSSRAERWASN